MAKYPDADQLGPPSLKIVGFQLWVHGWECAETSGDDYGDWLRVTAHCGCDGASVWATGAILQVMDIVRLYKECDALASGSVPVATLAPLEPGLRIELKKSDSVGHLEMSVNVTPNHLEQEHLFRFEIDVSYLPGIVTQCRAIEKSYPARGAASRRGV